MPLLCRFHMTLRVLKTGSPSVRFFYLLSVCCAYPEVLLRGTMLVNSRGSGGVVRSAVILARTVSSRSTLSGYSSDTLEFHISLPSSGLLAIPRRLLLSQAFNAWFWACISRKSVEKCDRKRVGALCSQLKLRQVRYRIRHETGGIRWTNSWNSLFTSLSNDWSAMLLGWVSADPARHGAKLTCHSSLLIHNWWKVPRLARILPPSQLPYLRSAGLPGA